MEENPCRKDQPLKASAIGPEAEKPWLGTCFLKRRSIDTWHWEPVMYSRWQAEGWRSLKVSGLCTSRDRSSQFVHWLHPAFHRNRCLLFFFFFFCKTRARCLLHFIAGASSSLACRRETSEGEAQMINKSREKKKRAKRKRC